jgi:hypothetical protein
LTGAQPKLLLFAMARPKPDHFDDEAVLCFHHARDDTASEFKKHENWRAAPVEMTKISAVTPASWKRVHG